MEKFECEMSIEETKYIYEKKNLLAAFYQLTYQHDSTDFNICNCKYNYILYTSSQRVTTIENIDTKWLVEVIYFLLCLNCTLVQYGL